MEVFENINLLLREKKVTKKEFAKKLRNLEPRLNSTLEIPSEKSIYAYLSGRIGIKIELIPYIAEVLEVPEQILFDDSSRTRKIYLKHILEYASSSELQFLKSNICEDKEKNKNTHLPKNRTEQIQDLLMYAPETFLDKLEETLKSYKDLTMKFLKN